MDHLRILGIEMEQQWSTKVENDAFQYLSICSILFASSVNSLIPLDPCCGLCCLRNRKNQNCLGGKGVKCFQDAQKSNFTAKCLKTVVVHCSLKWRLKIPYYVEVKIKCITIH